MGTPETFYRTADADLISASGQVDTSRLLTPFLEQKPEPVNSKPADQPAKPGDQPTKTDAAELPKQEWTVVVNLASNLPTKGARGQIGAEDKMSKLEELKESTKGKNITILAQQIAPDPKAALVDGKPNQFVLKRYAIRDGGMVELPQAESKNFGEDLTDLLKLASKNYPSNKVALVNNSHGEGNRGLDGDTGRISIDDFEKAVQKGLEGSGHAKLDLLDFDACLMAQTGVVEKMSSIAKTMIASADIEDTNHETGTDGQHLNAWLADVIENPQMDDKQLGRKIIDHAATGVNDDADGMHMGTPSLSMFDLEKQQPFNQALNDFGDALANTIKSKEAKDAIKAVIDSLPAYGGPPLGIGGIDMVNNLQKRDLGLFLNGIEKAVQSKQLPDADGKLQSTIKNVRDKMNEVRVAYYGNDKAIMGTPFSFGNSTVGALPAEEASRLGVPTYKEASGVSVFLPPSIVFNTTELARKNLSITDLSWPCKPGDSLLVRKMNAGELPNRTAQIDEQVKDFPEAKKVWEQTKEQIAKLQRAKDGSESEFQTAAKDVCKSGEQLFNLPPFTTQFQQYKKAFDPEPHFAKERVTNEGGWNRFVRGLKD